MCQKCSVSWYFGKVVGHSEEGGLGGGNWDIVAIPLRGYWEAVLVIFPIAVSTANKISGQSHLRTEMSV